MPHGFMVQEHTDRGRRTVVAIGNTSAQLALRDPDTALMLRVRAEEPGAFEELVEKYRQRLVAVMHHLVGNAEEAEDLAQEVFLRVYRNRRKYRAKAKFSTWLFTIANNLASNARRSHKRKPHVALPASDPSGVLGARPQEQLVPDRGSHPSQRIQRQELAAFVRRAVDGLNERQRVAVILNKFEEMNYAEIAEVMGLTTKAVKSLLNRARVNLRQALLPYLYPEGGPVPEAPAETD
jgi:RNA polymerase sigma-70 factor (ECF subfamily)